MILKKISEDFERRLWRIFMGEDYEQVQGKDVRDTANAREETRILKELDREAARGISEDESKPGFRSLRHEMIYDLRKKLLKKKIRGEKRKKIEEEKLKKKLPEIDYDADVSSDECAVDKT